MTTTTQTPQLAVAYTAPGQNANNEPTLNVLGMAVGDKIRADQTGFYVEADRAGAVGKLSTI